MIVKFIIATLLVGLVGCTTIPGEMPFFCFSSCDNVDAIRDKPPLLPIHDYDALAIGHVSGKFSKTIIENVRRAIINDGRVKLVRASSADDKSVLVLNGHTTRASFNQKQETVKGKCYNFKKTVDCLADQTVGYWGLDFAIKVKDRQTGKTLVDETFDESELNVEYGFISFNPTPVFLEMANEISNDIIPYVTPYTIKVSVKLYTNETFPLLQQGVDLAAKGNWDAAIQIFETAVSLAERQNLSPGFKAMANYNLGIALGYGDINYDRGIELLMLANSLVKEENNMDEIKNLEQFKIDANNLAVFDGKDE